MLEDILLQVNKPGRYIGQEWNVSRKDFEKANIKFALCFPDLYEVGMSNLGLRIIYGLLNTLPDVSCERVFSCDSDMEAVLRRDGREIFSLESQRSLREFDIIGFSLQYEMSYTNVLNMLDLAKIPLRREERTEKDPLIIAGGPLALTPEPISDFIDIFFVGDGEEKLPQFIEYFKAMKHSGNFSREEKILSLVKEMKNLYAPSLYAVTYNSEGVIDRIEPKLPGVPPVVRGASVSNLGKAYFPENPIVPHVKTIHDRISVEVMRGCTQGCRFCQAGMTKRPNRIRSVDNILNMSEDCYRNTGHDEISLGALSISDYPHLKDLMTRMGEVFNPKNVNIAFPSLRVSDELTELPSYLNTVRKSGLTFAPEAASTRLRKVINKNISNEDLFAGVKEAYKEGWNLVKLYFMVGLPTETDEDVEEIANLAYRVSGLRKEVRGSVGNVNITVSPFVPKAHTPFQWEPMVSLERIRNIRRIIMSKIRHRRIRIKFNKPERSILEGVFARGDRRLGKAILRAWQDGCRFDAWDDFFDYDKWKSAFEKTGLDEGFYLSRERGEDEVLPWDHISSGIIKKFLISERKKSFEQEYTPDCFRDDCPDCGACARSEHYSKS